MPRTEAGKRLQYVLSGATPTKYDCAAEIDAIEAESTAAERARIRTAVEGLPSWSVEDSLYRSAEVVEVAAVLAIIDREDTDASDA